MEYILCAAIWFEDEETPVHTVTNLEKGLVMCGHRHAHVIHQYVSMTCRKMHEAGHYEQGFLTSRNRFVSRQLAGEIAFREGQTSELKERLYSEDLY